MTETLLQVRDLRAGYGASQVLFDVSFELASGQALTLLGRNGMGKSTIIKCLTGMLKPSAGSIQIGGRDMSGVASYKFARAGIGLVPEGRQVFPTLTVRENLLATASTRNTGITSTQPWTAARVYELFPRLLEREQQLAGTMSGGEQQMLAIGRALMTNPRLLILDEATEGLAPLIRQEIWVCLRRLRADGLSLIIVDKNITALLPLADRHYVIEKGAIQWQGDSTALVRDAQIVERLLSV